MGETVAQFLDRGKQIVEGQLEWVCDHTPGCNKIIMGGSGSCTCGLDHAINRWYMDAARISDQWPTSKVSITPARSSVTQDPLPPQVVEDDQLREAEWDTDRRRVHDPLVKCRQGVCFVRSHWVLRA